MINHKVKCANFEIANDKSFTLIAGPCQLESEQHALDISKELKKITTDLKINRLQRIPRVPSIDMPVAPSEIPADTQRTGLLQAHRKRALVQ